MAVRWQNIAAAGIAEERRRRRVRTNPDTMTLLFVGAGALVLYYLVKNAGKGASPLVAADDTDPDIGPDILPPQGVLD